ncbi:hypothetical protein DSM104299_01349 [Baekduia alba]|uniref:hypothetical protein n=1 Tax=Baekduia alba TaxID=2997333 RepID=UPI002340319E|nr:hypothetical protein [Baekduia alba]WCB92652.1 hypothetical protein DSM104299_01349 [Baekduia alba]
MDAVAEPHPLEGIAEADAHLGREVPLPRVPLPLTRWVDVYACGPQAVEVAWNLDDTRPDRPGRVSLYAGTAAPPARDLTAATPPASIADGVVHREAPLAEAQPSLRPVHELSWQLDGLHLRLTAQGPWALSALVAIAQSVA